MLEFSYEKNSFNTEKYLKKLLHVNPYKNFDKYGKMGVNALKAATPVDTGKTSESWSYEIKKDKGSVSIIWKNSNVVKGTPIAIILQFGHGTKNGGYVKGIDYINPALQPIFDNIAKEMWREVTPK